MLASCTTQPTALDATLVLTNANIIEVTSGQVLEDHTLIISGERIAAIDSNTAHRNFDDTAVIDLKGRYVTPGLINSHVHLSPNQTRDEDLRNSLQLGITTLRDLGGDARLLKSLADAAESETAPAPDISFAAVLFGQKFMPDPRVELSAKGIEPIGSAPWMRLVTTDSDIRALIIEAKATGASGLKLYASLDAATMEKIINEARQQDMKTWTHSVTFPGAPEDIAAMAPDEMVHAKGLATAFATDIPDNFAEGVREWTPTIRFADIDPYSDAFDALFTTMVANDVTLQPALVADGDLQMKTKPLSDWQSAQRDWACQATKAAYEAGVTINAGTDYFGTPEILFLELERLHECGLATIEVLRAATLHNADVIGMEETHGALAAEMQADIVAYDENPLVDITALRRPAMVIKNGLIVRELAEN